MQLSSGHVTVNVSTSTGRLLSLTSQAGLLSAELSSEVHLQPLCAQRSPLSRTTGLMQCVNSLHRVPAMQLLSVRGYDVQ